MANSAMIFWNITAYLLLITVNFLQMMVSTLPKFSLRQYEITSMCYLAVYSICTLIFGLIVNTIVIKILKAKISESDSMKSSVMNLTVKTGSIGSIRTEDLKESDLSDKSNRSTHTSVNDADEEGILKV